MIKAQRAGDLLLHSSFCYIFLLHRGKMMVTCHICRKYKEKGGGRLYWDLLTTAWGGGGIQYQYPLISAWILSAVIFIGALVCILGWNCRALFLIFLKTNAETKYWHTETPKKAHTLFTHFVFSQLLDIADDCGDFILKTAQTEICRHAGASIS